MGLCYIFTPVNSVLYAMFSYIGSVMIKLNRDVSVNSLMPSDAYMRQ